MRILWYCFFLHVISSHSIPSNMLKILILRLFSYCSFLFFRYEIFDSDWLFLVGVCLHMKFVHFDVKVVFLKSQVSGLQKISVGSFYTFFSLWIFLDLTSWLRNPILHWWFELGSHTRMSRRFGVVISHGLYFSLLLYAP